MKETVWKGIRGATRFDHAIAARWAGIDTRYAGQSGHYPLECRYPVTASAILRNLAGERAHKVRWEPVRGGSGRRKWVTEEVRAALECRMIGLVLSAQRKLIDHSLAKLKKAVREE